LNKLRGDRQMPVRSEIDPASIAPLLQHMVLTAVEHDPLDFVYKITGEHIVHHAGRTLSGGRLTDMWRSGDKRDERLQSMLFRIGKSVIDTRAPVFADLVYQTVAAGTWKRLQCICLPLGQEDGLVDAVISSAVYNDHKWP
jgi:hypothetical protein